MRKFILVPGSGWCQDANGNEGRNRFIGSAHSVDSCRAACAQDALCVGYAGRSASGQCVVYSDASESAGFYRGWSRYSGAASYDFDIAKAGGSTHWSQSQCYKAVFANTCSCSGGTAAAAGDGSCEVDGAEDCTACDGGWVLNGQVCNEITCNCNQFRRGFRLLP